MKSGGATDHRTDGPAQGPRRDGVARQTSKGCNGSRDVEVIVFADASHLPEHASQRDRPVVPALRGPPPDPFGVGHDEDEDLASEGGE